MNWLTGCVVLVTLAFFSFFFTLTCSPPNIYITYNYIDQLDPLTQCALIDFRLRRTGSDLVVSFWTEPIETTRRPRNGRCWPSLLEDGAKLVVQFVSATAVNIARKEGLPVQVRDRSNYRELGKSMSDVPFSPCFHGSFQQKKKEKGYTTVQLMALTLPLYERKSRCRLGF